MKKMQGMSGFLVAAITPLDENGNLNVPVLHQLMDKNIAEGTTGFLIGGSSAECPMLSREERMEGLRAAAAYPNRKATKLMASVSSISTDEAILYAKEAEKLGYDCLISTVPYYYKFGMKGIADYFRAIREAVDLPLFLYNFPGNTGIELDIYHPEIKAILTDGTIAGVKQTSLNLSQMERMRSMNPELVIYGGYDEVYLGARILGADGAIGSTFNFTLPIFTKIEAAYKRLDIAEAQKLHFHYIELMNIMFSDVNPIPIKTAMNLYGFNVGECRLPLVPMSVAGYHDLKDCLAKYDLLGKI